MPGNPTAVSRIRNRRKRLFTFYSKLQGAIVPGLRNSQYEYKDTLLSHVNGDSRWLDLGCGHNILGSWMVREESELVRDINNIVGLDSNLANLRQHPNIRYKVLGDVALLPFKAQSFNVISANMVVEHLPNPAAVLSEIRRLLAPGGIFVFHTPNALHFLTPLSSLFSQKLKNRVISFLEGREPQDIFPTFYRMNTLDSITKLAGEVGLKVRDLKAVNSTAETFMLGPLVILELLVIRLLEMRMFRNRRSNLIAVLQRDAG
jgi:ubiquinone/menaquinone biosynthesis C-methylase UbiE